MRCGETQPARGWSGGNSINASSVGVTATMRLVAARVNIVFYQIDIWRLLQLAHLNLFRFDHVNVALRPPPRLIE